MRTSLLGLAALLAVASATPAAAAPVYPWCVRYSNTDGSCAFNTFYQCLETMSGIGGGCTLNPGYHGPAAWGSYNAAPRTSRRHHHY
jgi:opacity protein-like surface antigen